MSTAPDSILFEDTFTLTALNSAKYDRAQRLTASNTLSGADYTLELDINNELFPVAVGDTLVVALASTLALSSAGLMPSALALASAGGAATLPSADAAAKDDTKLWRDIARGKSSLADMYTYVCYGKVYRFEESENMDNLKVFVSFGGLLLFMEGPYKRLTPLRIDYVYLLVRKA